MAERKKMIDEKGRLFGKVNVIDIVVLALVLAIIVILGMKFLGKDAKIPDGGNAGIELEYTTLVYRLPTEVYDAVEKEIAMGGDHAQLMANGEMLEGCYVTGVVSTPHVEPVRRDDGSMVASEEPGYVDAIFTIRAVTTNSITQLVGTQEVRIGKGHIVKTKTIELVNGIILTCAPVTAG